MVAARKESSSLPAFLPSSLPFVSSPPLFYRRTPSCPRGSESTILLCGRKGTKTKGTRTHRPSSARINGRLASETQAQARKTQQATARGCRQETRTAMIRKEEGSQQEQPMRRSAVSAIALPPKKRALSNSHSPFTKKKWWQPTCLRFHSSVHFPLHLNNTHIPSANVVPCRTGPERRFVSLLQGPDQINIALNSCPG